jgi:ribonuclease P protein component
LVRLHGFPAKLRLKQRREFLRVQRGGRKHHLRHFMVFASRRIVAETSASSSESGSESASESASEPLPTRLGITVTRKVGDAVTRNRIKRMVREVFRQNRRRLQPGLDLVWVAKQQAAEADFAAVLADFEALVRRGDLLAGDASRRPERSKTLERRR